MGLCLLNTIATAQNDSLGQTPEQDEIIFVIVEDMPDFPGGDKALASYLKSVEYPAAAKEQGLSGRVYVKFVVNTDGKVEQATIARGLDKVLNDAAIKHVENMPQWEPGTQRGQKVKVQYVMPVAFTIEEQPEGVHKHYLLAEQHFLDGQYFKASSEYEITNRFYNNDITIHDVPQHYLKFKQGLCLHYLGQKEPACSLMKEARKLGSEKAKMMLKEVCK